MNRPGRCGKINTVSYFCLYFEGRVGMPKVAYSEAERERIRNELVSVALELMARQGIQHTTVEQI